MTKADARMGNYEPIHDPENGVTEQRTVVDSAPYFFVHPQQKHI
jgi:hypothetical protein